MSEDQERYQGGFDDVPKRDKLPPKFIGPGTGDDLTKMPIKDLEDEVFAVAGFMILPSRFEREQQAPQTDDIPFDVPGEGEGDQKDDGRKWDGKYIIMEIIMPSNQRYRTSTTAKAVMDKCFDRWKRNEIPFKCKLVERQSKSSSNTYKDLEDA